MDNKFSFCIVCLFAVFTFSNSELKAEKVVIAPAGMVKISSGNYVSFLTDKDTKPQRVQSFYMDLRAVSNAEFLEFVKRNPQWSKSRVSKLYTDAGYLKHWKSDFNVGDQYPKIKDSPVTNISWYAARAYAKWKGKRLPTLSEWEYVGNAPFLNDKRPVEKVILDWYSKPTPPVLPAAGPASENRFHVYGMHGLTWEWVYDFNSVMMTGDSRSNSAINRDLFCASGALATVDKENYAAYMRYAYRGSLKASYTVNNLGFRCARDIK